MSKVKFLSFKKDIDDAIYKAKLEALEEIGMLVEAEAKQRAVVDTGNLKRSITHVVNKSEKEPFATIGTSVEYAEYVEKGTSKMKARPFLQPAIDEGKKQITAIVQKAFAKLKGGN